jgi:Na+/citrate or Na+/malate symporter
MIGRGVETPSEVIERQGMGPKMALDRFHSICGKSNFLLLWFSVATVRESLIAMKYKIQIKRWNRYLCIVEKQAVR